MGVSIQEKKAFDALSYIIPILERLKLRWCITGGVACHVYGVKRPITDIDIDIEGSKDDAVFKALLKEIESYVTQPLEHFVDQNYDNYNFEITLGGQVIDICPMSEMKIFNGLDFRFRGNDRGEAEGFYKDGFPRIETVDFHGLKMPLLAKDLIIENKEMLVWQRESDLNDIKGLKQLLQ